MSTPTVPLPEPSPTAEHVVLVDPHGRPTGTTAKAGVHHTATPLHLGFSCYLVRADGAVLLTRRAGSKRTWPGAWTNACCGHPAVGEPLAAAIVRRTASELGAFPGELAVLLADFAYRATMDDGTVEHELCPVVVGRIDGPLHPDPAEVGDVAWTSWTELVERARRAPETLSPWCVEQVLLLDGSGIGLDPTGRPGQSLLDRPVAAARLRAAPAATPDPVDPVRAPLEELLGPFLDARAAALHEVDPALDEVVGELRALVESGGKRLRPAFLHWGHQAAGAGPGTDVLPAALAIELLHTFALVHDDVMDRSARRRGRPAAHVGFAERHRARGASGDADWFGTSAAVLAGDLAHVWADEAFEQTVASPTAMREARRVWATLRTEVMAGQHLDLRLAGEPALAEPSGAGTGSAGLAEPAATRVALLKSARYTVTRPLLLGAALTGSGPEGRAAGSMGQALRGYGDAVGLAFQLRDDVLGLFGDEATTGKPVVDDLREGKRTVLVLRALRLTDGAAHHELRAALGDPHLDAAGAARCREIVADSGALASVERTIEVHHEAALEHLDRLVGAPAPARDALVALAGRAVDRQA